MSQVIEFFRAQDPRLKDVPENSLVDWIGSEFPDFLKDAEFGARWQSQHPGPSLTPQTAGNIGQGPLVDTSSVPQEWKDAWAGKPAKEDPRRSQVELLTQWHQAVQGMVGSDPARAKQAEDIYANSLRELGVDVIGQKPALEAVGATVIPPSARAGKVTQAAVADLARIASGSPPDNLASFMRDPEAPLPTSGRLEDAGTVARWAGKFGLAVSDMVPKLGILAGLSAVGVPPTVANIGVLGFDAEGKPDPVGLLAATGLPVVDQAGRQIAAGLIAKRLAKTKIVLEEMATAPGSWVAKVSNRAPFLEKAGAQRALEFGGGQLANNLFLAAAQTPGILASDDPTRAIEDAIINNLAMSLAGAPELTQPGRTQTQSQLRARLYPVDWEIRRQTRVPEQLPPPPSPAPPAAPTEPAPPEIRPSPPPAAQPAAAPTGSGVAPAEPARPPAPAAAQPTPQTGPGAGGASPGATAAAAPAPAPTPFAWTTEAQASGIVLGKPTVVKAANGVDLPAFYALFPPGTVQASHQTASFSPNPAYAPLKNTRDYGSDTAEQEKVLGIRTNYDPYMAVSNDRSAATGMIVVSRGSDGINRVLAGNARNQAEDLLEPGQTEQLRQVRADEAAIFGLPADAVKPGWKLGRLIAPHQVANPEGIAAANRLIDLLNPSPGLVESTANMARNDAAKVDYVSLSQIDLASGPNKVKEWMGGLIARNVLDRNTRTQITRSAAQVTEYAQRLLLQAGYRSDVVVEHHQHPKTSATTRGLIEAGLPAALALRAKGENQVAAALTELIQRVADTQANMPQLKLDNVLEQVAGQVEGWESEPGMLARGIAQVLAAKVERLPPNKRGERKIDAEETTANFRDFFGSMARSIGLNDQAPDIFGQTRSMPELLRDFLKAQAGEGLVLHEVGPDPRVLRLNKLARRRKEGTITQAETRELAELEENLGQSFMSFHREENARTDAAEKQRQQLELDAGRKKRLMGEDLLTQDTLFGKEPEKGGQLALFDTGPTDEFGMPLPVETLPAGHPLLEETLNKATMPDDGRPREAWRNEQIESLLATAKPVAAGEVPVLICMGGGSASGKTTLLAQLQQTGKLPENVVVINTDDFKIGREDMRTGRLILDGIPEMKAIIAAGDSRAAAVVHEESSAMAKAALTRARELRLNVVYDATLSDPLKTKDIVGEFKAKGYNTMLVGVSIDPAQALFDAAERAKKNGRSISTRKTVDNHRSWAAAFPSYPDLFDAISLFERREGNARPIGAKEGGKSFDISDNPAYQRFRGYEGIEDQEIRRRVEQIQSTQRHGEGYERGHRDIARSPSQTGRTGQETGAESAHPVPAERLTDETARLQERRRRPGPEEGQLEIPGLGTGDLAGRLSGSLVTGSGRVLERSRFRVLARTLNAEIRKFGGVNLLNRSFRTPEEFAILLQPFRNPSFEIFHWVLVKWEEPPGKIGPAVRRIVAHIPITARIPNTTFAETSDFTMSHVRDLMQKLSADEYWMVHNHPSGRIIPSLGDENATKRMIADLPGFGGHIIIDHGKYTHMFVSGMGSISDRQSRLPAFKPSFSAPFEGDPLRRPSGELAVMLDVKLTTNNEVAGFLAQAASTRSGRTVVLGFADAGGRSVAVAEAALGDYTDPIKMAKHIERLADATGAVSVFAYYDRGGHELAGVYRATAQLLADGWLTDAILPKASPADQRAIKDSVGWRHELGQETWLGKTVTQRSAVRLAEPGPERAEIVTGLRRAGDNAPVALGGMNHVRPVEMPELVAIAKRLTGQLPLLRRSLGPGAQGRFRPMGSGQIQLRRDLFRDSVQAAQTLAHELGHLTDWLDDRFLDRGNILGRLAVLRQFLRDSVPLNPSQPLSSLISGRERLGLRREAERRAGSRPAADDRADLAAWRAEASRVYRELLEQEQARRGLARHQDVRREVMDLSAWWRPWDRATATEHYNRYRDSAEELYADALSVLLNDPAELARRAPQFYNLFWNYLDRKPSVKAALFDLQDFLAKGKVTVLDARARQIRDMFEKGEQIMARKAAEREARAKSWKGYWLELAQQVYDNFAPIIDRARKAEKAGTSWRAAQDPRNLLEQSLMGDNTNARFIRRMFEGVVKPLEDSGISMVDLGQYLMLRRVQTQRNDLANPMGITPSNARDGLLKLRLDIGHQRMRTLEDAVAKFHELVFERVKEAVRVGAYNRETFEKDIKPHKDVYAAFAVLDYLEDYVPAGIRQQVGTLKDIANPFTATVLKTVALNNLITSQRAKNGTRDLLQQHFPGEIEKLEGRFVTPQVRLTPRPAAGWGLLTVLENGRPAHYQVDPLIAHAFDRMSPQGLHRAVRVMDTIFRKGFYRLYITYSPSFLLFNPIRDFSRAWKNLPRGNGVWQLAKAYATTFRNAVRAMRGIPDNLASEMEANFAIGAPYQTMVQGHRDDGFGQMLRRYHMLPENRHSAIIDSDLFKPVRAIGGAMEFWGNLQEMWPKFAGYKLLTRQAGMAPAEAASFVRNYIGTPNLFKRGRAVKVIRAFIPFYNVFLQGWRADLHRMNPRTGGAYLFRWAATDGFWAVLTGLASAGLLGATLKELFGGASEYDRSNYNVIPIGLVPGGDYGQQVAYLRLPRDESSRLLSGLTYKLTRQLAGSDPASWMDLLDFGAGQVPGISPAVQIPGTWLDYMTGDNPVDPFLGRPILSRDEHLAGGWAGLEPMFTWTLDKSGAGGFVRWNKDAGTTSALALSAIPGLSRLVKISDRGYREDQARTGQEEDAARAKHRLALPESAQSLKSQYNRLKDINPAERTPAQTGRYAELNVWYNVVFRPLDEQIWLATQAGEESLAETGRDQLRRLSEPWQK